MPCKSNENYLIGYFTHDLSNSEDKFFISPATFVNDNLVAYPKFPHTEDDKCMIHSFLVKKSVPPAPEDWIKYPCIILDSFGKYLSLASNTL